MADIEIPPCPVCNHEEAGDRWIPQGWRADRSGIVGPVKLWTCCACGFEYTKEQSCYVTQLGEAEE
jgi:hypothetical protein